MSPQVSRGYSRGAGNQWISLQQMLRVSAWLLVSMHVSVQVFTVTGQNAHLTMEIEKQTHFNLTTKIQVSGTCPT